MTDNINNNAAFMNLLQDTEELQTLHTLIHKLHTQKDELRMKVEEMEKKALEKQKEANATKARLMACVDEYELQEERYFSPKV